MSRTEKIWNFIGSVKEAYPEVSLYVGIDKDKKIYAYFDNIEAVTNKKYMIDLTGRGDTMDDAIINLAQIMMDKKYMLRYKVNLYATSKLRSIIKKSNLLGGDD